MAYIIEIYKKIDLNTLTSFGNTGIISKNKILSNYDGLYHSGGEFSMKSTGIVRKVDELGRVVIPIELRRTLGINEKDALEIYVDDDKIVLKKYKPSMTCQITGDTDENNLSIDGGKLILSKEGAERVLKEIQDYLEK